MPDYLRTIFTLDLNQKAKKTMRELFLKSNNYFFTFLKMDPPTPKNQ